MGEFKLICCQCGSDNIVERSGDKRLDCIGDSTVHAEGIQRKCTNCNNEAFVIIRTQVQHS